MDKSLSTAADSAVSRIEQVLMTGNLAALSDQERVIYHNRVCETLGLNPLTRPFDYLTLNGKLLLYARKDATDQLRKINGVSITGMEREHAGDLYIVTVSAVDKDGRTDQSSGAVNTKGLAGEALANALMKAETKAKRRVTLSISGLGMLDESETDFLDVEPEPATARLATQAPPPRGASRSGPPTVAAPKEEPAISRFWRDIRAAGIQREQVVAHLGHEEFETLDEDQLGELLIQLKEKYPQKGFGV